MVPGMDTNSAHPSTSAFHGFAGHIATPKRPKRPNWQEEVVIALILLIIVGTCIFYIIK